MGKSYDRQRLKLLIQQWRPGVPFTMADLRSMDISHQLAAYYVNQGWLRRLGQGFYCFPNDKIEVQGILLGIQKEVPSLHIASKTALAWNGISQNLYYQPQSIVWGEEVRAVPMWMKRQFNIRYSCSHLFNFQTEKDDLSTRPCSSQISEKVSCSCPERALLEMLYELKHLDLEEVQNLFELVQYPRESVLAMLLHACRSLKVIRLFAHFSQTSGLLDVKTFYEAEGIKTGSETSWQISLGSGRKMTVGPVRRRHA